MSNRIIELVDVNKFYDEEQILDNVNLYIRKNEFLTLLGPSGCGKTTTLRIIGGFETPSSGKLLFDGEDIINVPPYKRQVNTVFQKYALFPNMNVFDNIAFALKLKGIEKKELTEKVNSMLALVNLKNYGQRPISSLSGGQQQRIAIARALANEPKVLLLDEPLGALDLKLRQKMQLELKKMQQLLGITFIYVTHDQEEALTMSDNIAVMNEGIIQQIGTPEDIYNEPKNAFVADFIGESNIFTGLMTENYKVSFANQDFECVDKKFENSKNVGVVVRPEDIKILEKDKGQLNAIINSIIFKGVHYEMLASVGEFKFKIHSTNFSPEGSEVGLYIGPNEIHVMKGEE